MSKKGSGLRMSEEAYLALVAKQKQGHAAPTLAPQQTASVAVSSAAEMPLVGLTSSKKEKRPKYNNSKVEVEGEVFDSRKEYRCLQQLESARKAVNPEERVTDIQKQVRFLLLPKQGKERPVYYVADFVVTYADGHTEVVDVKSEITRKNTTYILKRKMMLFFHKISLKEV